MNLVKARRIYFAAFFCSGFLRGRARILQRREDSSVYKGFHEKLLFIL
jgi:hypothetical protein